MQWGVRRHADQIDPAPHGQRRAPCRTPPARHRIGDAVRRLPGNPLHRDAGQHAGRHHRARRLLRLSGEATAIAHEKSEEIEHEVRSNCSGLTYSFTIEEGDHVELLARRTPFVDLAVVSQSHPAHLEDRVRLQIPDQLPMQSACPTIVLPWERRTQNSGHHTLIAWKNTRELAGRSVTRSRSSAMRRQLRF